jgi:hypothetical protein
MDVEIWGQEKLAAALTDHPEVERAFLRYELVDVLKMIHQEKAAAGTSCPPTRPH